MKHNKNNSHLSFQNRLTNEVINSNNPLTVSTNSNNGSQNFSSGIYHNTSAGIGVYHSSIDGDFSKNEASILINSRGNVDKESSGPDYA